MKMLGNIFQWAFNMFPLTLLWGLIVAIAISDSEWNNWVTLFKWTVYPWIGLSLLLGIVQTIGDWFTGVDS